MTIKKLFTVLLSSFKQVENFKSRNQSLSVNLKE